ncbi:MAG TPA: hypothetical protein VGQ00_04895, partial [Candidatus Norongarragalinales archaeon]|nr:hypothetical protein [Candidatus Norongarragalinales archaeon]
MVKLRAKIYEIEQGLNVVVLNEKQAAEIGVDTLDRVRLSADGREIVAVVNHSTAFVKTGEILLFAEAAHNLRAYPNQEITITIAPKPESLHFIRRKLEGKSLTWKEIYAIIQDLQGERLSSGELAAFVAAIEMKGMSPHETSSLTNAIFETGDALSWPKKKIVVSEHSIGGVAGDRTSMLIVPILASLGITIPK